MQRGRSFLIMMLVALGLGAYIYFVEMKREPASADDTPAKEKVFAIEPGKIEEVEVRAESGDVTTVRKTGDTWQIAAPQTLEADATEVGGLVSTIESLERQRVIAENPSSVTQYGLEPPRLVVSFKTAGDAAAKRLQVGKRTPTGGDLYARVEGDPRVFLISSYLEDSLNKTTFNLRDKTVLKFGSEAVDGLTLQPQDGRPVTFAKQDTTWRLTSPLGAKADFSAVDGLVSRVSQARMKAIESSDASAADLKKFGLDKPQATITIGAGSTRATLALGGKKEGDDTSVYARDLSRPLVFTVDAALVDDAKKPAADYRAKDVFEFRSFSATGVDFTLNGQAVTFGKEKPAGQDQASAVEVWKVTKPAAKDVDQTKATDMLTTLSNLRAESFADTPLASGDELIIVARFTDGGSTKEDRVTLRKSGDAVHAIVPGEPGAAVVLTADYDKVVSLLKELAGLK
jgi:hypothetical protein